MSEVCGAETVTTGGPCQFQPADSCPHHGSGAVGNPGAGRPTVYDEGAAREICRRMAAGETLRGVCRDDHLPPESTVRGWVVDDREGFAARYARARRMQVDHWADEILRIADDGSGDTWTDGKGRQRTNHDVIRRSELRVDTRKFLMSKLHPEVYGDRSKVEVMGEGGGAVEYSTDRPMNAEQKAEAIEDLLEQARAREGAVSGNGAKP